MNDGFKISAALMAVCLLVWIWPNLVHEPLHAFAAKIQGVDASIAFDWSFPPHPYTTAPRIRDVSLTGAVVYVLLPSAFSIILLFGIWLTHHRYSGLLTHVSLPAYLGFDLIVNMLHYTHQTSDFHFFILMPFVAMMCICIAGGLTALVVGAGLHHIFGRPSG